MPKTVDDLVQDLPGPLRGKALEILVGLGGQDALDDLDREAVDRLVRIKLLDELPVAVPLQGCIARLTLPPRF
ncbi:hypothetical protein ACFV5E_37560 [Streptomyces chartreusis]|uniref:hypothetical protein n=1 Tax=Streptomyces chartreusis TaxID=1969 RepID=UPI00369D0666